MTDDRRTQPPSAGEVARRALCSAVISALGGAAFELRSGATPPEQVERWAADIRRWAAEQGLAAAFSGAERSLFDEALGEWDEQAVIDAAWRQESIGVLLWALSAVPDWPPYDRQFSNVAAHIPLLQSPDGFLHGGQLRPLAEIQHERDLAELWQWRARTTQLLGMPEYTERNPDVDVDGIVRRAASVAHRRGHIPAPIDGDFPAFGRAYRDISPDEHALAMSIARERHRALNWLCGYAADWEQVPTVT